MELIQNFVSKNFSIPKETLTSPSPGKGDRIPARWPSSSAGATPASPCRTSATPSPSHLHHPLPGGHGEAMYKDNLKVKREIDFLIEKFEAETA